MRTATVKEVQEHLVDYLEELEAGQSFSIVHRGRPIARLVPASRPVEPRAGSAAADAVEEVLRTAPIRTRNGVSAVKLLIEERRQGR